MIGGSGGEVSRDILAQWSPTCGRPIARDAKSIAATFYEDGSEFGIEIHSLLDSSGVKPQRQSSIVARPQLRVSKRPGHRTVAVEIEQSEVVPDLTGLHRFREDDVELQVVGRHHVCRGVDLDNARCLGRRGGRDEVLAFERLSVEGWGGLGLECHEQFAAGQQRERRTEVKFAVRHATQGSDYRRSAFGCGAGLDVERDQSFD